MENMAHRTATERTIADIWKIIIWHKTGIIAEDVYDEALIKAENVSTVVLKLQSICDKTGVDQMVTY